MKKKIRKISTNGREYYWLVSRLDRNYVCLKVWLSQTEKIPWIEVKYRFDDPWIHFVELIKGDSQKVREYFQLVPVRPKLVAQIIERVNTLDLDRTERSKKTLYIDLEQTQLISIGSDRP